MISVAMSNPAVGEITRALLTQDPQHPVLLLVEDLRQGEKGACELAAQWALDTAEQLRHNAAELLEAAGYTAAEVDAYLTSRPD